MMCFVCETMYSALFSVITTWFKGALIDFYIKICYNIYIRNDIFLEYIHNKGVLKMIGSKYLSQLVSPSMLS